MSEKQKQLWIVYGKIPADRELPVYATLDGDTYNVYPACYLLSAQHKALDGALSSAGFKDDKVWKIPRKWLNDNGERSKAVEPEECVFWGRMKGSAQIKKSLKPKSPDLQAFIDYVYRKGIVANREDLELLWYQFCHQAVNWIVVERKPLDMGFIKLHPSPYRPNWKQVLLNRFPKLGPALWKKPEARRDYMIIESGLRDEMLCLDLLALDKSERCYRTLEVEYRKGWIKAVHQNELNRMAKYGREQYADRFMSYVKQNISTNLKIYFSWLSQIARPSARARQGDKSGAFSFEENTVKSAVRHNGGKAVYFPPVVLNKPPQHTGYSEAEDLHKKNEVLPKMSDLQQSSENVRQLGANDPAPKNGEAGASGVSLLPPAEKQNEV